jgi:hypothetical protein
MVTDRQHQENHKDTFSPLLLQENKTFAALALQQSFRRWQKKQADKATAIQVGVRLWIAKTYYCNSNPKRHSTTARPFVEGALRMEKEHSYFQRKHVNEAGTVDFYAYGKDLQRRFKGKATCLTVQFYRSIPTPALEQELHNRFAQLEQGRNQLQEERNQLQEERNQFEQECRNKFEQERRIKFEQERRNQFEQECRNKLEQ